MYEIETSKVFDKFIAKHSDLREQVFKKLEILAKNPYKNNLDIAKLQGFYNHYRLRIGKYRVI